MAATSQASRAPAPKICPRCGAFYQDLTSQICPQCFAKLEPLTDDEAQDLIEAQEKRAQDPEFLKVKAEEDEQFREQSFGACLGLAAIILVVVVASIVLMVVAVHHRKSIPSSLTRAGAPVHAPLPNTAILPADINEFIPANIGHFTRSRVDATLALPGTTTRIYHGVYNQDLQVYAVNAPDLSDQQLDAFHLAVSFVAEQHNPPLIQQETLTANTHYIIVGARQTDVATAAGVLRH